MNLNTFCLKFVGDPPVSSVTYRSNPSEARSFPIAWLRRLVAGIAMVAGLFASANALAATYTVTTTADSNDGSCGGTCSLRDAITAANGSLGNTVNFTGVSGAIMLTSALPAITQSMSIVGPYSNSLTISGRNSYQIFKISSGTVVISGLTLTGGSATDGGAIYNSGTLTVMDDFFYDNSASTGAGRSGGAIYNQSAGSLAVINSTFFSNVSSFGSGGAIYNGGMLTVTNSTFEGNVSYSGGAIFSSGTLTANNNIFTENSVNSSNGAGIDIAGGTGEASYDLFYQNLDTGGAEDDCYQCTSNTNAISGNPDLLTLGNYGGPTDTVLPQPGSPAICAGSYANVPSGVTTDQRGFPLTGSTCSNGGVDVGAVQSDYVQVTSANDSGAGSLRAAITAANATSYGGDIDFASGLNGTITLNSALPTINQSVQIVGPGAGTLTISGNNAYQIFNISSGAVMISGLTLANGRNANGNGGAVENGGALTVLNSTFTQNSATATNGEGGAIYDSSSSALTITNSTFSGNSVTGSSSAGGAIEKSTGVLMVFNSTFTGNSAIADGGAISSNGLLEPTNVTFSGNQAANGGAIEVNSATVINSTFSGNTAVSVGGAIKSNNSTLVFDSTFSGNSVTGASGIGGAIGGNGLVVARDNIFAENSAGANGGAAISGSDFSQASFNLYYQNFDAGTTEDDCYQCLSNDGAITGSNPLLTTLGNYGGVTQTILPTLGSPAICAGSTSISSGLSLDQRGFSRTTTYGGTVCLDLGAVQTNYTAAAFSSGSYGGTSGQALNPTPVVTVTENGQNIGGVPITLSYSGTGSPMGLGPVTTVADTGAAFSNLMAPDAAKGTLSVNLPITASGNAVQPTALTASASLNITSTTQTITLVAPSSLTYGTAPTTLTAMGGASGNPVIFSLDPTSTAGAATLSGSTLTITGVGAIVIDANQAAGAGYVAAAQVQQSIVVNPAPLTVTALSPTVTYGSPVPTITPTFGTFFNGDTSAVLTRRPACVTAYTTTSAVASSPSTSCSGAMAANYTFNYVNGSVTVNPAPTFVVSGGSNSSLSLAPGAATGNSVSITVTPSNGFTGTVNLSCSVSPVATSDPVTCSLSPSSVTITGTGAQTSTLTITTTAATSAGNELKKLLWPSTGTALALLVMFGLPRRRGWLAMLALLALAITVGAIGCGGGGSTNGGNGSGGNTGTTPGTYTVTVTGSAGSITGTVGTVTLTVN